MTGKLDIPANLDEARLNEAVAQVRAQAGWCPKIGEILEYELQTLLGIAIRSYGMLEAASRPAKTSANSSKPRPRWNHDE